MRSLILFFLLTIQALAIPAHRLSLEHVVAEAEWAVQIRVVAIEPASGDRGSGLRFTCARERVLWGEQAPKGEKISLLYWESWPQTAPDRKVEAPIWTGSGLERKLAPGDRCLALGRGGALLRAEPLDAEPRFKR